MTPDPVEDVAPRPGRLTAREQRALDAIARAVSADDPRLEARLRTGFAAATDRRSHRSHRFRRSRRPRWTPTHAVALGTALLLAGFGCLVAGAYLGPAGPLVVAAVVLESIGALVAAFA